MKTHGLTEEKITEYYPKKLKYDNGLQDLVFSSDEKQLILLSTMVALVLFSIT